MAAFPIAPVLNAAGQIGAGAVEVATAVGKYTKEDAARKAALERKISSGKTLGRQARADILAQGARQEAAMLATEPIVGTGVTGPVAGAQVAQAAQARAQAASIAGKQTADVLAQERRASREAAQAEVARLRQAEAERKAGIRGGVAKMVFAPLPGVGQAIDAYQQARAAEQAEVQAFRSDVSREYSNDPQFKAKFDTLLSELERVDPQSAAKIRSDVGVL